MLAESSCCERCGGGGGSVGEKAAKERQGGNREGLLESTREGAQVLTSSTFT